MNEKNIERRLDQIVRILALIVTKDEKDNKIKVLKLTSMGFNNEETSEILGLDIKDVVKVHLNDVLDSDKKKSIYILTANKNQTEIKDMLNTSPNTISDLWKECTKRGLMKKEGQGYKPLFDLKKFNLIPKGFKPEEPETKPEKKPKEGKLSF